MKVKLVFSIVVLIGLSALGSSVAANTWSGGGGGGFACFANEVIAEKVRSSAKTFVNSMQGPSILLTSGQRPKIKLIEEFLIETEFSLQNKEALALGKKEKSIDDIFILPSRQQHSLDAFAYAEQVINRFQKELPQLTRAFNKALLKIKTAEQNSAETHFSRNSDQAVFRYVKDVYYDTANLYRLVGKKCIAITLARQEGGLTDSQLFDLKVPAAFLRGNASIDTNSLLRLHETLYYLERRMAVLAVDIAAGENEIAPSTERVYKILLHLIQKKTSAESLKHLIKTKMGYSERQIEMFLR